MLEEVIIKQHKKRDILYVYVRENKTSKIKPMTVLHYCFVFFYTL